MKSPACRAGRSARVVLAAMLATPVALTVAVALLSASAQAQKTVQPKGGSPGEWRLIGQNIPQGGESRAIDLRGIGKRSVRRIDFWYDTKGFLKGKADVTVFGMK